MSACIVEVHSDGGCIRANPSKIGGTWAWCHVGEDGWRVREASGVIVPADVADVRVTNHETEVLALLLALEALPEGWSGRVCSDSKNALRIFFHEGPLSRVPEAWWQRIGAALRRAGDLEPVLVKGHPSKAALAAGQTPSGKPVSPHNVRVDQLCARAGERHLLSLIARAS